MWGGCRAAKGGGAAGGGSRGRGDGGGEDAGGGDCEEEESGEDVRVEPGIWTEERCFLLGSGGARRVRASEYNGTASFSY